MGDNNFSFVLGIINFPNLLNDEWGVRSGGVGNGQAAIVAADLVSAADVAANGVNGATALTGDDARTTCTSAGSCVYRFNEFDETSSSPVDQFDSLYEIRVGLRYEF